MTIFRKFAKIIYRVNSLKSENPPYRCAISNEAFQTLADFFQIAGFAPTRLIIFVFRLVIGQYFESGILFMSAGQSGDERQGD